MRQLIIPIAALVVGACANAKQPGEEFFPTFAPGAQWEYAVEIRRTPFRPRQTKMIVQIVGEETLNGKKYLKSVTQFPENPKAKPQLQFYRRTPQGAYQLNADDLGAPEQLILPFPVAVGDTWTYGQMQATAEAIEPVALLSQTYDRCLKLTYRSPSQTHVQYYAADVGLVKVVTATGTDSMTLVLEKFRKRG